MNNKKYRTISLLGLVYEKDALDKLIDQLQKAKQDGFNKVSCEYERGYYDDIESITLELSKSNPT